MSKLNIPSLSSRVPSELKNAFNAVKSWFADAEVKGGVATAQDLANAAAQVQTDITKIIPGAPAVVTGLTGTPSTKTVNGTLVNVIALLWDTSVLATGYVVRFKLAGDTVYRYASATTRSATTMEIGGLVDASAYHLSIKAINAIGASAWVANITVTTTSGGTTLDPPTITLDGIPAALVDINNFDPPWEQADVGGDGVVTYYCPKLVAGDISATTITGKTIKTATTGQRMEINNEHYPNEMVFYAKLGISNYEGIAASIGLAANNDFAVAQFGYGVEGNSVLGLFAASYSNMGIAGQSYSAPGIQGSSSLESGVMGASVSGPGLHGISQELYGVEGEGPLGAILLRPLSESGEPTATPTLGAMQVSADGDLWLGGLSAWKSISNGDGASRNLDMGNSLTLAQFDPLIDDFIDAGTATNRPGVGGVLSLDMGGSLTFDQWDPCFIDAGTSRTLAGARNRLDMGNSLTLMQWAPCLDIYIDAGNSATL